VTRVVGLAGWSGSGKTTLLTRLLPILRARGVTVSTIKHAHEAFDIDVPGKDSYEHRAAGAHEVLVSSANRYALVGELRGAPERTLPELLAMLAPVDLVIVEGFKRDTHAKVEVHRAAVGKPLLFPDDPTIRAIVTEDPVVTPLPRARFDDLAGIVELLLTAALPLDDVTVVIVAGGSASRLPGKLGLDAGGLPLLVRVYRNVSPGRPTVIAAPDLAPELAAAIPAPRIGETGPKRGPLGGLLAAFAAVKTPWAFAVAGDAPFVDAAHVARLAAARQPGDEAIVPRHSSGQVEPLAALYDVAAFTRAGTLELAESGALHKTIARLRARFVEVDDPRIFANINTPEDYARLMRSWPA
jgi:molybdopterin-guanine dinucleotide biosynthesis adapter protein